MIVPTLPHALRFAKKCLDCSGFLHFPFSLQRRSGCGPHTKLPFELLAPQGAVRERAPGSISERGVSEL